MPTTEPGKERRPGIVVAWCAVVLGVSMSVAANALHVVTVVGPGMGGATIPQIVSAAFWPIALVIMIEVIARVRWPDRIGFALLRWCGAGVVALVAAIVSYRHMHGLLVHWREDTITALLGPIGVDGLVTVGAVALLAIGHEPLTPEPTPAVNATTPAATPHPHPQPQPEPAPAPAPAPKTVPAEAAEIPPAPVGEPSAVDTAALKAFGLGTTLEGAITKRLDGLVAAGRRPAPGDLSDIGIPSGMATKVIARTLNGRAPAV